ncbi:hypothetical protein PP175_28785 (plasmid) [Aneurinibacillus sp. Ricciae_BoGa-3]|uniref:hypothetical protein n=1 Tax=Aneurinibacillus sp. Ricciae_BoGa-3 TaxID=3022697 RepID=UPI00233F993D|nr:hypothetical protein [Aneurinibacillus sp. Ricciae_BoGa-3]WCK57187.1 hypothetical protein PP175_28785 [Aneurinibacillus sp. Ricciae_BoGa-3]
MVKNDVYDLNFDFKEVKEVMIEETLSQEEINEGLEPETLFLKVALTGHAYDRMNNTAGRDCEWMHVEDLIVEKGNQLFNVKYGEEFVMINDTQTIAVVARMHRQYGDCVLILETVIRNVIMDRNLRERENKVSVNKRIKVL